MIKLARRIWRTSAMRHWRTPRDDYAAAATIFLLMRLFRRAALLRWMTPLDAALSSSFVAACANCLASSKLFASMASRNFRSR